MRVKAKMEARDKDIKKRTKELEIAKGAMYAVPFYGKYAPCGAAKRFDQTFSKFDAWCESMAGRRDGEESSAKEGRYINTQRIGGEKR